MSGLRSLLSANATHDRLEVVGHVDFGGLSIVADNRVGNIAVLKQSQLGLVAREQSGTEIIEEGLEGIEHMKHGDVFGTSGDKVMKMYVFSS